MSTTVLDYDLDDSDLFFGDPGLDGIDFGALLAGLFGGAAAFEPHETHPAGVRVFDWEKAAARIKETGAQFASAGLSEDWSYTGGPILEGGEIVSEDDTYTFLASRWATPVLVLDGKEEECWTLLDASDYDETTYWPTEARSILGS